MLKALEVQGFKSFAEKTRFDFPEGITVVVGPNGSGKSNVIDAIKWVLGAQSAKAMRGKEMADVIFKGSSAGRKPANTAEASIVFDNSRGTLAFDAEEITVTRRVYRSGEGEYLLNGEACRLRDIKDLFRGTGVGTDAYSVIEQGKVGAMLQSSGKERRAMFEEAAGISRFKAKKVETERRLARVDQNLLRLSDIVEEVERRLKSVRSQATKAAKYREYSTRLQQLRTQIGLVDWQNFTKTEAELTESTGQLSEQIEHSKTETTALAKKLESVEAEIAELEHSSRDAEQQRSAFREKIAGAQAAIVHHRRRHDELTADAQTHGSRVLAAVARLTQTSAQMEDLNKAFQEAQEEFDKQQATLKKYESRVAELAAQVEQATAELTEAEDTANELRQQHDDLSIAIRRIESQAVSAAEAAEGRRLRLTEVTTKQQENSETLALHQQALDLSQQQLDVTVGRLNAAVQRSESVRKELTKLREQLSEKETQRVRLAERENVLADLERRREGVNAAAKEVLARSRQPSPGVYGDVAGLLADLIEVNVEASHVIEAALGERAQYLVVTGDRLVDHWERNSQSATNQSLTGRVGIVRIHGEGEVDEFEASFETNAARFADLEQTPGVIGRADRFVQAPASYASVVRRFLGQTWVVEDTATVRRIRQHHEGNPRLVTLDGTVWETDGTAVVGPPSSATGLITRRSELRSLREELSRLDAAIPHIAEKTQVVEERIAAAEADRANCEAQRETMAAEVNEHQSQVDADRRNADWLAEQAAEIQLELDQAEAQQTAAKEKLEKSQAQLQQCEADLTAAKAKVVDLSKQREQYTAQRSAVDLQINTARLETSRSQQRTEGLTSQRQQLQMGLDERQREVDESHGRISRLHAQIQDEALATLRQTSQLSTWYLESETHWRQTRHARRQRQQLTQQRAESSAALRTGQQSLHQLEQKLHQAQTSLNEAITQRQHLAERMLDDYGVDLATATADEDAEELGDREEVESEIADLRRKINNIGAVNMDALNELDDLETRFGTLHGQYEDLTEAKAALEKIIHRINSDSRRLFAETLEAIRVNFQQLYRKLFGGGHADLVMEDGIDLLDSGIEIVANPPGKPAFSNSLLSGGEQGLTAVALLMAIFQHKPSPFCILDEVDAPLDESNIGRFVGVLREFLDTTKFVVVTHSKKTMTAANTLYGVTMQEPNVSKRVSVQFEDVSEDGEISAAAIAREAQDATPDDDDERGAA